MGRATATTNDYTAVNLGQLKALAQPFYDQLMRVGYATTYPWNASLAQANDYAAANIGQVKNLFSFDLTAVTPANDLDGDGIPDWWERAYFPTTYGTSSFDPNALSANGDGLTILQSFQQGINPNDFFNGQRPTVKAVSGDAQVGPKGGFAPAPLIAAVTDTNGNPVAGAPVTFSVSQGGGQVQQSYSGSPGPSFTVLTNGNGQATAFCKLPDAASSSSSVVASVTSGTQTVSATFTETSDDGTGTYRSPFSPSFVTGQRNPDGSEDLSWVNNTDDATPVIIYAEQSDGSWTPLLTLPPGTTSCHLAAAQGPVQSYGVGAPGTSVTPPYYPIPVQSYAEVDVSGDDPSNSPVTGINLRDDNQLAFCVSQYDSQGEQASVTVKTWANGTVADKQTMQSFQQWFSADGQHVSHQRELDIWTSLLSANGDLCGNQTDEYYGPDLTADDPSTAPWVMTGGTGGAFSAGAFTSPMPPFMLPNPPPTYGLAYVTNILGSSYSGASLYTISGTGHPDANGNLTMLYGVMACTTPNTLFGIPADPKSAITISPDYFEPGISYGMINSHGWVIPQTGSPGKVWDGTKYISLPGNGVLVNESNDVVSGDYTTVHPETLGLLQKGTTYLPFFSSGTSPGMIPARFQSEVRSLYPLAMSNRLGNLPASPAVPVLHLLLEGQILRSSGTATWWEWTYFLLRQLSDGTTDFYEANAPLGLGAATNKAKINANGLLCVAADPDGDSGPTAQAHAFLLLPVQFSVDNWKATITPAELTFNAAKSHYFIKPPNDAEVMDAEAGVTINIPNIKQADSLAQDWDLVIYQNIILSDPGAEFTFSALRPAGTKVSPIPGMDSNQTEPDEDMSEKDSIPRIIPFKGNHNQVFSSMVDTPANSYGTDLLVKKRGYVLSERRNNMFVTWLFAQRRSDNQRVFLRWFKWNASYEIDFDLSGIEPPSLKLWNFQKLDEGTGMGPMKPVDTPIKKEKYGY